MKKVLGWTMLLVVVFGLGMFAGGFDGWDEYVEVADEYVTLSYVRYDRENNSVTFVDDSGIKYYYNDASVDLMAGKTYKLTFETFGTDDVYDDELISIKEM